MAAYQGHVRVGALVQSMEGEGYIALERPYLGLFIEVPTDLIRRKLTFQGLFLGSAAAVYGQGVARRGRRHHHLSICSIEYGVLHGAHHLVACLEEDHRPPLKGAIRRAN